MKITSNPASKEYLENYDRIFGRKDPRPIVTKEYGPYSNFLCDGDRVIPYLRGNEAEQEKANFDCLAYGTGVTTKDADGVVKHIPLSEFLMEASDEN